VFGRVFEVKYSQYTLLAFLSCAFVDPLGVGPSECLGLPELVHEGHVLLNAFAQFRDHLSVFLIVPLGSVDLVQQGLIHLLFGVIKVFERRHCADCTAAPTR
jgi:hypothetical protein